MSDKKDGIYQRPDSPYWWMSYPDTSGKTARRSTGIRTALDPHGIEARRVRDGFIAPSVVVDTEMSWDELVEAYLPELERKVRASTLKRYEDALRALYHTFSGKPANVPTRLVKDYIRARVAQGYAPSTINIQVGLMCGMYRWAIDELELPIQNPWSRRALPVANARERYLTRDEADRLLNAARGNPWAPYLADFIELSLHTGMRTMEVLGLTWDRVDLDANTITFGAEDQKSGKRNVIPINSTARRVLLRRQEVMRQEGVIGRYVIFQRRGKKLTTVVGAFRRARTRAGLPDVHPHDLRRTFATWMIQAGASIQHVSGLLRHQDIKLTASVYAHLSADNYREAAELLDVKPKLRSVT